MIDQHEHRIEICRAAVFALACTASLLFVGSTTLAQDLPTPQMTPNVAHESITEPLLPGPINSAIVIRGPSVEPAAATGCPFVGEWEMQLSLWHADLDATAADMADQGFRPISVSADGAIESPNFDVVWLKDDLGENHQWYLRHDRTAEQIQQDDDDFAGCRLVSIDAYGFNPADLRYIAAWACDGIESRHVLAASGPDLLDAHEQNTMDGFSPVWVDGWFDTDFIDDQFVYYSAIWADDGGDRKLAIDLPENIDEDPIWNGKTDAGYRMVSLSEYFDAAEGQTDLELLSDPAMERRFAAVWEKIPSACAPVHWEAFRQQPVQTVAIKAAAQRFTTGLPEGVNDEQELELLNEDLPGRILLDPTTPGVETVLSSVVVTDDPPENGTLLLLEPRSGERFHVIDEEAGNIRLRRWDAGLGISTGVNNACDAADTYCGGQPLQLDNWQHRLVLQYVAGTGEWHEVQRNGLSPERFRPIAIDNGRGRYASVWVGQGSFPDNPTDRRFLAFDAVTPSMLAAASVADRNAHNALDGTNPTDPMLDDAMRKFMEERLITNAVLGIAVNGRLVVSRAYAHASPQAIEAELNAGRLAPDMPFRIASLSKPLTAVAVMRLAAEGLLDLDQRLDTIPGMVDAIGQSWDGAVYGLTPRRLLNHLGGWDRDKSPDYPVASNFSICGEIQPAGLPTDIDRIIQYVELTQPEPDHTPGTVYVYSNFGYLLLGRVIEAVTGSSYEDYMRNEILLPIGMDATVMHPAGPGGQLPGEVRYYEPGNPMTRSVFGIPDGQEHPDREECNRDHADLVLTPYGEHNTRPMDSFGGWVSTAPDLLRFLSALDDTSFLSTRMRGHMWSRPDGRATRVFEVPNIGAAARNRSFDAALVTSPEEPIVLFADNDDSLVIGKGLTPFNRIVFTISAAPVLQVVQNDAGEDVELGHDLEIEYYSDQGWQPLTSEGNSLTGAGNDVFVTLDSANQATITFEPPDDWIPRSFPAYGDVTPRFYIQMRSLTEPDTAGEASKIEVAGPNAGLGSDLSYALGWNVGSDEVLLLPLEDLSANLTANQRIVGEESQASAMVFASAAQGSTTVRVSNLIGGSFLPGEPLLLTSLQGTLIGRVGDDRERVIDVSAWHGGKLSGVRTFMKRRLPDSSGDRISWMVMVNQANTGSSFYIENNAPSGTQIDTEINKVTSWPSWDLFAP